MRKEKNIKFENGSSGINITFTRKGIELAGYFDSFVGIEGGFISWTDIDLIRIELGKVN